MIGAAFGAFGQGLAAGFLAQRRMADVAGKGLMGLIQGGAGAKPLAPDAFAALAASLNTMAPSVDIRRPAAPANAGMPPAQHAPGSIGHMMMQPSTAQYGVTTGAPQLDNLIDRVANPPTLFGRAAENAAPAGPPQRLGPRGLPAMDANQQQVAAMRSADRGDFRASSAATAPAAASTQPAMSPPPQWAQQYPGTPAQPSMPSAPESTPAATPTATPAAAPAATPTPAAAEMVRATPPVPRSKPGDGLVWSDRGPGDRLMMVRRDALRPGEQSFAVTEGTIGAGRGLPSMEATSRQTTGADTVAAAPVTPVTIEDLDPLPRGMGGPLKRNGPTRGSRGASLATINGGGGSDTLQGSGGADMRAAAPFKTADPVATDLPPHARAFLNGVAGGESGGRYDIRYTPKGGATFTGFDKHPRIYEQGPHGKSSAAGRYQFTYKTWKGLMGDAPFTPQNQDHAAWKLAQQDYAARTKGRSLDADLRAGGLTDEIMAKLTPTWQAFKSNRSRHAATYQESLARYTGGQAESGASAIASAGPAADGAPPREDRKERVADATSTSSAASGGEGAEVGREAPAARTLPTAAVGVQTPEISNPIVGGGEPVNMAGARTVASRGLPPARPAQKSNTWAALRAALTKDAA